MELLFLMKLMMALGKGIMMAGTAIGFLLFLSALSKYEL